MRLDTLELIGAKSWQEDADSVQFLRRHSFPGKNIGCGRRKVGVCKRIITDEETRYTRGVTKKRSTIFNSHERNGYGYRLLNKIDHEAFIDVVVMVVVPWIGSLDIGTTSIGPGRFPRHDVPGEIRE
jgi:hypothetical protein